RVLPAEAGLDQTHIDFTKGCYPGQEPIARLHYRGHVNRRLRVLEVESAAPGDERSEEHTSELQSRFDLVCRLLLEKKKKHTREATIIISQSSSANTITPRYRSPNNHINYPSPSIYSTHI